MSGAAADRKRLIKVTAGNLRHGHLYITGHYDFFPADILGGSTRTNAGVPITIEFQGMNTAVTTDIATEKSGKPRRHFMGTAALCAAA